MVLRPLAVGQATGLVVGSLACQPTTLLTGHHYSRTICSLYIPTSNKRDTQGTVSSKDPNRAAFDYPSTLPHSNSAVCSGGHRKLAVGSLKGRPSARNIGAVYLPAAAVGKNLQPHAWPVICSKITRTC